MKNDKANKAIQPDENKIETPEENNIEAPEENNIAQPAQNKVRIQMRQGRAAEGVTPDKDGIASVDAKTAEALVSSGYAVYVK